MRFPLPIVVPPVPSITSVSPAAITLNTAAPVTIHGVGFTSVSTVLFDGVILSTTLQDDGSLAATVPASAVRLPGVHS